MHANKGPDRDIRGPLLNHPLSYSSFISVIRGQFPVRKKVKKSEKKACQAIETEINGTA
jgi:hypothetical protein